MKRKRENRFINNLAGLCGIFGLAGFLLLNEEKLFAEASELRNRRNNNMKHGIPVIEPGHGTKDVVQQTSKPSNKTLSQREFDALTNHIKAMTNEELEVVVQAIPVSLCMWRIQTALDHAAEFETMIKKAYEMKQ